MIRLPKIGDRVRIVLDKDGCFVYWTPHEYVNLIGMIERINYYPSQPSLIEDVEVSVPNKTTLTYHLTNIEFLDPLTNKEAAIKLSTR